MKKSVIMAMTLFFAAAATTAGAQTTEEADKRPAVYFIEEITPENLVRIYEALGRKAEGRVAVKVSTGEPGGHNFLQPTLIADLVTRSAAPSSSATPPMAAAAPILKTTSRRQPTTASHP